MAARNDLVTKPFLKSYLRKEFERFGKKLKVEIKNELLAALKDDLYRIKDEIVGEFKKATENQEMHQASHTRINGELEDHEERITRLEQPAT